ncbi:MAG: hypothetical protein GWO22_16650, partial [Actinobacteria bacterium]|nr:hypothetical protein [Actinomycetota bacterium]NIR44646.1 hypothetical protein [Gemmatimonadota bacterium]NIW75831.1 hypothetical protein [Gemmatimonadota bacterium]
QEIAVSETGGLRSTVVFIEGIEQGKPWPDEPEGYTLTQEDCTFAPHVQV